MEDKREEVEQAVKGFIQDQLLADGISLGVNDSLTALGLDSFSLIEILLFVERQFDTVVPIETLNREKTETVSAISNEVLINMSSN